jgi:S1-C subfamily serine protease
MRLALVASFALGGLAAAAPPPEAVALQKHLHQLIDAAEPSIACVLISRSKDYTDFGQGPSAARDGRLGEFRPPPSTRWVNPAQRDLIKRLDLASPETVPEKYGSGVVIDGEKGLILTTFHVIEGATKIYVRLPGTGRGSYADIHAGDPRADLAVLRMLHPPADLRAIPIGDGSKVRKGDWIVSLSNPFAAGFRDGSPSAAWGIVSNLRRRQPQAVIDEVQRLKPLSQYSTLLQTDVRINLGCSGGAVLNMDGELVGLTTALAAIEGGDAAGGFAVPTDANTRKMIDVLKRGEEIEYGLLGITVNPEQRGDGRGVPIQDATAGMPAGRAGLQPRDLVTSIDGHPIRDQDDLFLSISAALAGSEVKVGVLRNGVPREFTARLTKAQQGPWEPIASNRPRPVHGLRVDYASTQGAGAIPADAVVVSELEPGSPAANKLNKGMYVVAVNGKPVPTPADFYRLAAGKGPVTLDVVESDGSGRRKVTLP